VIFARLKQLFGGGYGGLLDEDLRLDRHPLQAKAEDWGFEPRSPAAGEPLIVESFGATDVTQVRSAATAAIQKISAQGEGYDSPAAGPDPAESHFERFFDIYKRFQALSATGVQVTWPVTENPNTTEAPSEPPSRMQIVEVAQEAYAARGRLTHDRARTWAQLFNLRYRLLLGHLSHFLRLNQELYAAGPGPHRGDRTARGLLLIWTFGEMRHLKKLAGKLVQLPRDDPPGDAHAGPPFELPYTLNLPDSEQDRWRTHLDVSRASVRLVREQLKAAGSADEPDGFLDDLISLDEEAQVIMRSLAAGTGVPEGSMPAGFRKAVLILEEAVRGFDIVPPSFHAHFWAGKTRDEFLATTRPAPPVQPDPQGGFDFDPDHSTLIKRLEGSVPGQNRMPRFRPAVAPERIGFLRDWISGGCPDNVPAGEIGLRRERSPEAEPAEESPPARVTPLSFASDIAPLFRDSPDRDSMITFGGFDLHRFEDVRDHADDIRDRLEDGSMPCDGSWPADRIATFRKWIDDGKRP
jgi:hypothetical protein